MRLQSQLKHYQQKQDTHVLGIVLAFREWARWNTTSRELAPLNKVAKETIQTSMVSARLFLSSLSDHARDLAVFTESSGSVLQFRTNKRARHALTRDNRLGEAVGEDRERRLGSNKSINHRMTEETDVVAGRTGIPVEGE